jgi:hypothetical protein
VSTVSQADESGAKNSLLGAEIPVHELAWKLQRSGTAFQLVMRSSDAGPFAELKYPIASASLALLSAGSRRHIIRRTGYKKPEILIGSSDPRFDEARLIFNRGDEAATFCLPDGSLLYWRSGSLGLGERIWTLGVRDVMLHTRNIGSKTSEETTTISGHSCAIGSRFSRTLVSNKADLTSTDVPLLLLLSGLDLFLTLPEQHVLLHRQN